MIELSTDMSILSGGDATQIEIDTAPYAALLTQVLTLVASGRLNQEAVIKLVHRCNYSLFKLASAEPLVQTEWLQKTCEMLTGAIQSLETMKFGTFQLIISMWKPIITAINAGDISEQLS